MDVEETTIYTDTDGSELRRAAQMCTFGYESGGALTYEDGCSWSDWCETVFDGSLLPHLRECYNLTNGNAIDQVIARDADLAEGRGQSVRDRLSEAGCQFLETLAGAKHVRAVERVRDAVLDGECGGLFPTVFAMQAALFHVPLQQAIIVYLFLEWKGGQADRDLTMFLASGAADAANLSAAPLEGDTKALGALGSV